MRSSSTSSSPPQLTPLRRASPMLYSRNLRPPQVPFPLPEPLQGLDWTLTQTWTLLLTFQWKRYAELRSFLICCRFTQHRRAQLMFSVFINIYKIIPTWSRDLWHCKIIEPYLQSSEEFAKVCLKLILKKVTESLIWAETLQHNFGVLFFIFLPFIRFIQCCVVELKNDEWMKIIIFRIKVFHAFNKNAVSWLLSSVDDLGYHCFSLTFLLLYQILKKLLLGETLV